MSDFRVVLAAYLTDNRRVTLASLGLQAGGATRADAEQFFELRNAFGVSGYMTSGEAYTAINHTLEADKNA